MTDAWTILSFARASTFAGRRALRADLRNALRSSESPVIVDLTGQRSLDHEDINLLLECVEQGAGRDTPLFLVAGSHVVRVLLEVTRIASLVPVFSSLEEALQHPCIATNNSGDFPETNLSTQE
jgi:hypothetical protein